MRTGPGERSSGPTATVTVPAELRFLEVLRVAVRVAVEDSGCDGDCDRDLQLAVDELASILIICAKAPSGLKLAVTHDETDVYVRMAVPISEAGFRPEVADLTRLLLDATVDSYEVRTDAADLVGVLQRSLGNGPHE